MKSHDIDRYQLCFFSHGHCGAIAQQRSHDTPRKALPGTNPARRFLPSAGRLRLPPPPRRCALRPPALGTRHGAAPARSRCCVGGSARCPGVRRSPRSVPEPCRGPGASRRGSTARAQRARALPPRRAAAEAAKV